MSLEEIQPVIKNSCTDLPDCVYKTPAKDQSCSVFEAICFVYGNIVGVGIFITISATYKVFSSDSIGMVGLFWIVGSCISIIGALCYAELARRFPQSGGEVVYYEECLDHRFSSTFIIMFGFFIKPLSLAAISLTASKYFAGAFLPDSEWIEYFKILSSIILLLICFALNCIGRDTVAKLSILFMIFKSFLLLLIIICGAVYIPKGNLGTWKNAFVLKGFDFKSFSFAFVNILWAFEGWNSLGFIAGKVTNPRRNVPLSLFFGVLCVSFMYVLSAIGYCSVLGFESVRNSEAVGLELAKVALGKMKLIMPILICISAFGYINGSLFSTGEAIRAASQKELISSIFSLCLKRSGAPIISYIFIITCSMLCFFFEFQKLIQYRAFIIWFFYFLSFICLWKAKVGNLNKGSKNEGFSIHYVFILIVQVMSLIMLGLCFYLSWIGCLVILIVVIIIFSLHCLPRDNKFFEKLKKIDKEVSSKFSKCLVSK